MDIKLLEGQLNSAQHILVDAGRSDLAAALLDARAALLGRMPAGRIVEGQGAGKHQYNTATLALEITWKKMDSRYGPAPGMIMSILETAPELKIKIRRWGWLWMSRQGTATERTHREKLARRKRGAHTS